MNYQFLCVFYAEIEWYNTIMRAVRGTLNRGEAHAFVLRVGYEQFFLLMNKK